MSENEKVSIQGCLKELSCCEGHKQPLGPLTPLLGYPVMVSFALFLLPLYLYTFFFNWAYFSLRGQKPVNPKNYFKYDRHKVAHLDFMDKMWCEYCEWANGTLQWTLAITNEIEKRYCPIKNKDLPHCHKAKSWRKNFLDANHAPNDLKQYYQEKYSSDTESRDNGNQ